jgi:hypothetical protein
LLGRGHVKFHVLEIGDTLQVRVIAEFGRVAFHMDEVIDNGIWFVLWRG